MNKHYFPGKKYAEQGKVLGQKNSFNQLKDNVRCCTFQTLLLNTEPAFAAIHGPHSLVRIGPGCADRAYLQQLVIALIWSDSVNKLVSVLFGKCTTLWLRNADQLGIRQPCGDQ